MATQNRKAHGKKLKQAREEKRQELQSLSGTRLGEMISFRATGPHNHVKVTAALSAAGLDTKEAREFKAQNAFTRACNRMSDERIIEKFKDEGDDLYFQFTRSFFEKEEISYKKECMVTLNKVTGKVTCKIADIQKLAQETLDRCMEERTTSDITSLVQRLFRNHSHLIPDTCCDNLFFVPQDYAAFSDQVQRFLTELGGQMSRYPIIAGTKEGDATVKNAVFEHVDKAVAEFEKAISEFTPENRVHSMERQADRIKDCRVKLESLASILGSKKDDADKAIEALNLKLAGKIRAAVAAQSGDVPAKDYGYPSEYDGSEKLWRATFNELIDTKNWVDTLDMPTFHPDNYTEVDWKDLRLMLRKQYGAIPDDATISTDILTFLKTL